MSTNQQFQETIKGLRSEYLAKLPEIVQDIAVQWNQLQAEWREDIVKEMRRHVHKMAGTAGSFGFAEIVQEARPLDRLLQELLNRDGAPPNADDVATISQHVKLIKQAVDRGNANAPLADNLPAVSLQAGKQPLVYVVDDDENLTAYLAAYLQQHGYAARVFNKLAGFAEAIRQNPPAACVVDINLTEGELAGPQAMYNIQKSRARPLPLIFMSARVDIAARLAAVRANGDAYFTKPLDMVALMERLDALTIERNPPLTAYPVLIIDDTGKYVETYAKALQQAGLQVGKLNNPLRIFEALEKFKPALMLINTQLASLSGLELAMVIRQQEKYQQIPIVFFAQQFDQTLRRIAMRGVGDDFLSDLATQEQLVSTVINRLRKSEKHSDRARDQRRDRLTGLYNRNHLLTELEILNRRSDSLHPLGVLHVMLDNYRGIDKILGVAASEAVVVDVARMLEKLVSKREMLGRLSNDVFAVICADQSLEEIRALAEAIRQKVEGHIVEMQGQHVLSTCSIGISLYHQSQLNPDQILQDAEAACNEAHSQGGNRVAMHASAETIRSNQQRLEYWKEMLRLALENDTFYLVYQHIASLHGEPRPFYDVLLRLANEEPEGILPGEFLPMAARFGLIPQIDRWVIRHVIAALQEKHGNGKPFCFFARISAESLADAGFLGWLEQQLGYIKFPPSALIFDFSVDIANKQLKAAEKFAACVKQLGCRLALRDFDGGTTSQPLFKRLDADFIKLSADLVRNLADKPQQAETIQHLAKQIHSRNKIIIAPFVEDLQCLHTLWEFELDYICGNFVERPQTVVEYDFEDNDE